jgi:outer membrane protein insertion porin family
MSAFVDVGAAFDAEPAFDELRYSAGVAVLWVSPMGPLKFSLAKPLVEKDGDETEVFQFTLGNVF